MFVLLRCIPCRVSNVFVGRAPTGRAGESQSQPATRVITQRCFLVFSCAVMVAPTECNHWLPSVWSACQWLLIKCRIGSWLMESSAAEILGCEKGQPASTRRLSPLPPCPV